MARHNAVTAGLRRLAWCTLGVVGAGSLYACGAGQTPVAREDLAAEQLRDGCATVDVPVEVPEQHVERGDRFGTPEDQEIKIQPVSVERLRQLKLPSEISNVPVAGIDVTNDSVGDSFGTAYYLGADPSGLTVPVFMDRGGIAVQVTPSADTWTLDELDKLFPNRMVTAQVGDSEGRLNWADPDSTNTRSYGVYWVAGNQSIWIRERRGPSEVLNAAREIACQPTHTS